MGKDVTMLKDLELKPEHLKDKDILISLGKHTLLYLLGGDGTYLRASGFIDNSNMPILGLNTDPSRSVGFVCNKKVYYDQKEKNIQNISENLEKQNFQYFYRQRLNIRL